MTWRLVIPGQPVSWNQSYRVGVRNRKGYGREGQFRTIIKTDEAVAYTETVTTLARVAKPSGWLPTGFVVIEYYYFLGHWVDADNVMKLVDDGLAAALGVDDRWFLPRAMSMMTGLSASQRMIGLLIRDLEDSVSQWPGPAPSP